MDGASGWPPLQTSSAVAEDDPEDQEQPVGIKSNRLLYADYNEDQEDAEKQGLYMELAKARGREAELFVEVQKLRQDLEAFELREKSATEREELLRDQLAESRRLAQARVSERHQQRDHAMREHFEMIVVAMKLKHGPFSQCQLFQSTACLDDQKPQNLYDEMMAEGVAMWDWHWWVEHRLFASKIVKPPVVHAASQISRMCSWTGAPPNHSGPLIQPKPPGHSQSSRNTMKYDVGDGCSSNPGIASSREDSIIHQLGEIAGDTSGGSLL